LRQHFEVRVVEWEVAVDDSEVEEAFS
jgi:hypothetical protein